MDNLAASTTDPDARLAKIKGKEAKLSYRGHILVENRNGLIADCELTQATGTAEPEAAATMLGRERTRRGKGKMTVAPTAGTTPVASWRGSWSRSRPMSPRSSATTPSTAAPHATRATRYPSVGARWWRNPSVG